MTHSVLHVRLHSKSSHENLFVFVLCDSHRFIPLSRSVRSLVVPENDNPRSYRLPGQTKDDRHLTHLTKSSGNDVVAKSLLRYLLL